MADNSDSHHLQDTQSSLANFDRDQIFDSLKRKNVPFIRNDNPAWQTYAQTYNQRLSCEPLVIIVPETIRHISDAVLSASNHGVPVQAKSGGHSYAGFSNGGFDGSLVIHMGHFQDVSVDKETGIAKVGGGTRLGPLSLAVWEQCQRALAHGTCSAVGIGGHYTHGGYGHFSRAWGLAMDQIVALDVVLADGRCVHVDSTHYDDIFNAMRGAADMIGIAINFYLQTQPAPAKVVRWELDLASIAPVVDIDRATDAFMHLQEVAHDSTVFNANISFGVVLGPARWFHVAGIYIGSEQMFRDALVPHLLSGICKSMQVKSTELGWIDALKALAGDDLTVTETYSERSNFYAKSVTIPEPGAPRDSIRTYMEFIATVGQEQQNFGWYAILDLYGGAGSTINMNHSSAAYRDRGSMWVAQHQAYVGGDVQFPEDGIAFLNSLNQAMSGMLDTFGAYLPYVDSEYDRTTAKHMYYGQDLYARIQKVKRRFDPTNVFANPHSIRLDE
ncbi:hypothetical protein PFICI_10734 [Pestalotiopsis fici W106-1]|uniref:FAD-binding PCMH-type domain-containing protein n=1 Tax=Pestalotiopsis fici (strain W106-1 / CGMCC3.15140) TaxID=1229662 RepID=W3WSM3_PESFW|nr:uncharacterized protein PFICI_10734 [Pestalotiopsis fici W106-1]ETS76860.1 hypothetical protein PFICI_10734 [Pestalotiopsis fici W106-1]